MLAGCWRGKTGAFVHRAFCWLTLLFRWFTRVNRQNIRRAKPTGQIEMAITKKEVIADVEWWRSRRPHGWGMIGMDGRDRATFISPDGRHVEVDGELLTALLCIDERV